ncbi:hypothetical protein pb186bvf_001659 [Paramecium bursaria]
MIHYNCKYKYHKKYGLLQSPQSTQSTQSPDTKHSCRTTQLSDSRSQKYILTFDGQLSKYMRVPRLQCVKESSIISRRKQITK